MKGGRSSYSVSGSLQCAVSLLGMRTIVLSRVIVSSSLALRIFFLKSFEINT